MPSVAGLDPIVPVMKSQPWFVTTGQASLTIVARRMNSTSIVRPIAISNRISITIPTTSRSPGRQTGGDDLTRRAPGSRRCDQSHGDPAEPSVLLPHALDEAVADQVEAEGDQEEQQTDEEQHLERAHRPAPSRCHRRRSSSPPSSTALG